ncbi:MAG: neutral/alkaline non-lysosomal ceramidase N-terminal domain-containing protein [Armatimonadota bacterium]|nr:SCP2 sterol-binding domain-containing protein [bacterium]MDW8320597.1 neutral/alkaline non-lysosomal ceramidase N-terminal domain-containing protein [Armatimonadota bacterium]
MVHLASVLVSTVLFALLLQSASWAQLLQAGAARVKITPDKMPYLAGYDANRRAREVHDDVYASAVVIQSGETKMAIVSCDLIGLLYPAVQDIRSKVTSVPAQHIIIASTHTHSGPDCIGLWGQPEQGVSGVDREWYAQMKQKVADAIEQAARELQPAVMRVASAEGVTGVSRNVRVAEILDTSIAVLQLRNANDNKTIATLVNYAVHPELMDTHSLTSDIVHYMRQTIEGAEGGIALFLNGALGGMVTVDSPGNDWKECERVGNTLGQAALSALKNATALREASLTIQRAEVTIPLENERFRQAARAGLFPEPVLQTDEVTTEVMHVTLGPVEMVTLPGEALPNIGFQLKRHMKGNPKLVIGLANDELGYILTEADYGLPLYRYETSMSVGEKAGRVVTDKLLAMVQQSPPTTGASKVAAFFDALPSRFRAERAQGVKVLYRFNVTGEGGGVWEIEINNGKCTIRRGASGARVDVTINTNAQTFLAIVEGRMAPDQAYMSGQLLIDGDLFLAQRIADFFAF